VNFVLLHLKRYFRSCLAMISSRFALCTKPLTSSSLLGSLADLGRSKSQLIAENALLRQVWKRRSKAASHTPQIAAETIALIREMAMKNRLWGAERIRGELLKLGIHVCKRTIQKYMRRVRTPQPRGQKWSTFLHNHAAAIWSCDAPAGDRSLLSTARRRSSLSN
jgi:hypothetical protein